MSARRSTSARVSALLVASLAIVAACGGPSRAVAPPPPGLAWDSMSPDQKMAYMKTTVMPRMRALFVELDPHKYPKMDCVPCHSPDRARGWKMPNPDLTLDPLCISGGAETIYGSEEAAQETAKMSAFMRERVQPAMAALLGRPSYDASTKTGFDCFGCHAPEPAPKAQ